MTQLQPHAPDEVLRNPLPVYFSPVGKDMISSRNFQRSMENEPQVTLYEIVENGMTSFFQPILNDGDAFPHG